MEDATIIFSMTAALGEAAVSFERMLRRARPAILGCLFACGTPAVAQPLKPPPAPIYVDRPITASASASSAPAAIPVIDSSDRIARIERGLVPPVRVLGAPLSWSLEERMRARKVPAISVAVFHDYRLQWVRSYGVADADTGERVTDATRFHAGPVSAAVTALATLKLAEAGRFSLDQPINELLTTWKLPDNDLTRGSPVTLRRLLGHTAGTGVNVFLGYLPTETLPTINQVLDGEPAANTPAVRVFATPGSASWYSAGGLTIAQVALVDRIGRPFPTIVQETVFDPLGMTESTLEQPSRPEVARLSAAGHDRVGKAIAGKRRVYPETAADGLWTTPADLARFLIELQLALEGRSSRVSKDVAVQMTRPALQSDPNNQIAHGVFLMPWNGAGYFGYSSMSVGYKTIARARFEKGYGAVVMANSSYALPVLEELMRAIAIEYRWDGLDRDVVPVDVDPKRLETFAGRYASGVSSPFVVTTRGNRLVARGPFRAPIDLVHVGSDTFVALDEASKFRFDAAAREIAMQHRSGFSKTATRVADGVRIPMLELDAGHYDEAAAMFRKLQQSDPQHPALDEGELNRAGYFALYERADVAGAIRVFRLNVELHPHSFNAYDSLAEAFERAGDKKNGIATWKAALESVKRTKTKAATDRDWLQRVAEKHIRSLQQ